MARTSCIHARKQVLFLRHSNVANTGRKKGRKIKKTRNVSFKPYLHDNILEAFVTPQELDRNWTVSRLFVGRATYLIRLLYKVKALVGRSWGLSPEKIRWIYLSIVRPKLTYGAHVWGHDITSTTEGKMCRLQRLAINLIANPKASTPSRGLEVLLGLTPLHLHAREVALKTHLRLSITPPLMQYRCDGLTQKGHKRVGHKAFFVPTRASLVVSALSQVGDRRARVRFPVPPNTRLVRDESPQKVLCVGSASMMSSSEGGYAADCSCQDSNAGGCHRVDFPLRSTATGSQQQ